MVVILSGGSCIGKTTLEKRLITKAGYLPMKIFTNRPRRDDDPIWLFSVGEHYPIDRVGIHHTKGINGFTYAYGDLGNPLSRYVVSIIELKEAIKLKDALNKRDIKVKIVVLDRGVDKVIECLCDRNITIEEAYDRYIQYLEIMEEAETIINADEAYKEIVTNF